MKNLNKFILFWLDSQGFALHLENIERIVRIVEVKPLPKAPEYILGSINFQGEFLPVINMRKLFLLEERDIDLNDQLIITQTEHRKVALWVDKVGDIVERSIDEIIKTDKVLLDIEYVEGLFEFEDGVILLHDLDKFLRLEQISLLKEALEKKKQKN
ncbi:MAG: chemotaxis protein CheW [bacterium]